jgi:mRNA-degrading endonuclease toxin of MazEF toxin-antitoxin module
MEKDFKTWLVLKEKLDKIHTKVLFNEREIWWSAIGCNVGEESNGKGSQSFRPVLVFKKLTRYSFVALPLTTAKREGSWYVPIVQAGVESKVMINQIRILDSKRIFNKMSILDMADWERVKHRFQEFYCQ